MPGCIPGFSPDPDFEFDYGKDLGLVSYRSIAAEGGGRGGMGRLLRQSFFCPCFAEMENLTKVSESEEKTVNGIEGGGFDERKEKAQY